jgi:hypothetical protein
MGETRKFIAGDMAMMLHDAASRADRISGLTHNFYIYPARFSPWFARAAIQMFSRPGQVILDPYMGGGSTIVEAVAAGRDAIGSDINPLSAFVTRVKTTLLSGRERGEINLWVTKYIPTLKYNEPNYGGTRLSHDPRTRNLNLARGRFIKKVLSIAIRSLDSLASENSRAFIRCGLLRTGQQALDGRTTHTSLPEFRRRLTNNIRQMLTDIEELRRAVTHSGRPEITKTLLQTDAATIYECPVFAVARKKADVVVTSPPYPGLHVLYHRWQVDGRKETPAPYWITGCQDGHGGSYYCFGDRKQKGLSSYFENALRTLNGIRRVIRDGAFMVQMLAFQSPDEHLPRYLDCMDKAGFREVRVSAGVDTERIWRLVPNRKWHATLRGRTSGSKEVVLVHRAQ